MSGFAFTKCIFLLNDHSVLVPYYDYEGLCIVILKGFYMANLVDMSVKIPSLRIFFFFNLH